MKADEPEAYGVATSTGLNELSPRSLFQNVTHVRACTGGAGFRIVRVEEFGPTDEHTCLEAHEQNRVVVEVVAKVAEGYANGGYFVVVDGIIGPWFLQPLKALTVSLHYVVLCPALDVAIQRCRERGGNTLADPEPITALYQQLSSIGELERHVLRTGHSAPETLSAVISAVNSGAYR